MHHIFFDTEFIEDGRTIDLISIGMVSDDNRELYLVSSEFDESKASDWVRHNVLPQIAGKPRHTRSEIAAAILEFAGKQPEWWAYFADYDWVALCQLFGPMIALPSHWPQFCMDVKQWANQLGIDKYDSWKVMMRSGGHDALCDARCVRQGWQLCRDTTVRDYTRR